MRTFIASFILILVSQFVSAQDTAKSKDPWKNTRAGNGFFRNKDFKQAEQKYRDALKTDSAQNVVNYNLGNALYEQGKYEEAEKAYANALDSKNPDTLNRGWKNLGNSLYQQKKYGESVEAYKEALRNNPNDEDARYNLAMAQKQLRNQQQQSGQSQGGQGQQQQQQQGQQQQQQGQQDKNGNAQNSQQQQNNNGQQQQPALDPKKQGMSQDEARKVMSALRDSEQKTRQKMNQNGSGSYYKPSRDKDW
jgi:tetratricopeptide (TPR) repeat protein